MRPIDFEGANDVLRRPRSMTANECADLPIRREASDDGEGGKLPLVTSRWMPTPEEREILLRGGVVEITVLGSTHPPIALGVVTA